jgi:hypothetical protein
MSSSSASLDDMSASGDVDVYTREQFDADRARITARICEKHGIVEAEIDALIREHRYEHDSEDIEDEWIGLMAIGHHAGWLEDALIPS